ncbi:secreted protein [Beggiatoa sp. PS]|nr:secreted protein [Beggiatoa sp. PS]
MVNLKIILSLLVFSVFASNSFASFDWGTGCEGGSGTFQQYIQAWNNDPENAVTVGTIPEGMKNVSISLKSDKDVDIRIYDANGTPIVHWPNGLLWDYNPQSTFYNNVTIEYSGYHGDGTNLGYEYIKATGTTQNAFIMKAFGYEAGYATVDYSWDANEDNCGPDESGSGSFQQQILQNDIIKVGDIPPGINNLYIQLISDKDVDIQLYDKDNGTKIVVWPDGILRSSTIQSTNYQGMIIEWSGYNGDGTGKGHEYIKITGETTRNLRMMAYGYQAGYATVDYSWGSGNGNPLSALVDSFVQSSTGNCIDMDGKYGCQCVDLMHSYIQEVLGVPRSAHNIRGNAYPIYNGLANSTTISSGTQVVQLNKIPNTPSGVPQKGDIIFWTSADGFGHVAIFISGDVNSFTSLDQNWVNSNLTQGSAAAVVTHNYNNVVGWLHPVIVSGTSTPTPTFSLVSQGFGINADSPANTSNVNMWSYSNSDPDQIWTAYGSNIKRNGTNLCLNAYNPAQQSNVNLYTCNTNDSEQQWEFISCNTNGCLVRLVNTSYCLNAYAPSNGSNLNLYVCDSNDLEQRFLKVDY